MNSENKPDRKKLIPGNNTIIKVFASNTQQIGIYFQYILWI